MTTPPQEIHVNSPLEYIARMVPAVMLRAQTIARGKGEHASLADQVKEVDGFLYGESWRKFAKLQTDALRHLPDPYSRQRMQESLTRLLSEVEDAWERTDWRVPEAADSFLRLMPVFTSLAGEHLVAAKLAMAGSSSMTDESIERQLQVEAEVMRGTLSLVSWIAESRKAAARHGMSPQATLLGLYAASRWAVDQPNGGCPKKVEMGGTTLAVDKLAPFIQHLRMQAEAGEVQVTGILSQYRNLALRLSRYEIQNPEILGYKTKYHNCDANRAAELWVDTLVQTQMKRMGKSTLSLQDRFSLIRDEIPVALMRSSDEESKYSADAYALVVSEWQALADKHHQNVLYHKRRLESMKGPVSIEEDLSVPLPQSLNPLKARAMYYQAMILKGVPLGVVLRELYRPDPKRHPQLNADEREYIERICFQASREFAKESCTLHSKDFLELRRKYPTRGEMLETNILRFEGDIRENDHWDDKAMELHGHAMIRDLLEGGLAYSSDTKWLRTLVRDCINRVRAHQESEVLTAQYSLHDGRNLPPEIVDKLATLPYAARYLRPGSVMFNVRKLEAPNGMNFDDLDRETAQRLSEYRSRALNNPKDAVQALESILERDRQRYKNRIEPGPERAKRADPESELQELRDRAPELMRGYAMVRVKERPSAKDKTKPDWKNKR